MTDRERIEEAHGLWEIAVVRLAALAEAGADKGLMKAAVLEERIAFGVWRHVSNCITNPLQLA